MDCRPSAQLARWLPQGGGEEGGQREDSHRPSEARSPSRNSSRVHSADDCPPQNDSLGLPRSQRWDLPPTPPTLRPLPTMEALPSKSRQEKNRDSAATSRNNKRERMGDKAFLAEREGESGVQSKEAHKGRARGCSCCSRGGAGGRRRTATAAVPAAAAARRGRRWAAREIG